MKFLGTIVLKKEHIQQPLCGLTCNPLVTYHRHLLALAAAVKIRPVALIDETLDAEPTVKQYTRFAILGCVASSTRILMDEVYTCLPSTLVTAFVKLSRCE